MSALPQHKKSPEELAKLRESLGIPTDAGPAEPPAVTATAVPEPVAAAPSLPAAHAPRTTHSLKRSERSEAIRLEPVPVLEPPGGGIEHLAVPTQPLPSAHEARPVRSLKRSERLGGPVTASQPRPAPSNSTLPGHRHSDEELAEIRRRSAISAIAEGGYLPPQAAGTAMLAVAYVLAIGGAATPKLLQLLASLTDSHNLGLALGSGYHLVVGCAVLALPVAAYIFFKKSLSRHHSAFISIIVLFSLVFAVLHYFPQLRYGA